MAHLDQKDNEEKMVLTDQKENQEARDQVDQLDYQVCQDQVEPVAPKEPREKPVKLDSRELKEILDATVKKVNQVFPV